MSSNVRDCLHGSQMEAQPTTASYSPGIRSLPHQNGTVFTVAISGSTCSGKTTVVERLCQHLQHVIPVHQDDFYKEGEYVPKSPEGTLNWDVPEALDTEKLLGRVRSVIRDPQLFCSLCTANGDHNGPTHTQHLLLIEGTMILSLRELRTLCHLAFFITIDFDLCQQRRKTKTWNWPHSGELPDPPGYFDKYVWPAYLQQLEALQHDTTITFLDSSSPFEELVMRVLSAVSSSMNRPIS